MPIEVEEGTAAEKAVEYGHCFADHENRHGEHHSAPAVNDAGSSMAAEHGSRDAAALKVQHGREPDQKAMRRDDGGRDDVG